MDRPCPAYRKAPEFTSLLLRVEERKYSPVQYQGVRIFSIRAYWKKMVSGLIHQLTILVVVPNVLAKTPIYGSCKVRCDNLVIFPEIPAQRLKEPNPCTAVCEGLPKLTSPVQIKVFWSKPACGLTKK